MDDKDLTVSSDQVPPEFTMLGSYEPNLKLQNRMTARSMSDAGKIPTRSRQDGGSSSG